MFSFFNSIKTVHECQKSGISLSTGDGACLSYGENEDEGINDLPNGFICQLPDNSVWAVKNSKWIQLSISLSSKATTNKGGASW